MSFISDLLSKLAETPREEHENAIAEAMSEAKATPAEISTQIGDLFNKLYGDGETIAAETIDQLEILASVAESVDQAVQEQAARAARAEEIGKRIEGLESKAAGAEKKAENADDAETNASKSEDETSSKNEDTAKSAEAKAEDTAAAVETAPAAPAQATPETSVAPAQPAADVVPAAKAASEAVSTSPELVAANVNRRVPLGQIPSDDAPATPRTPNNERFSLVAAADIPGFSTGEKMSGGLGDFASAWESRMFPMITGKINSGQDGERTRVGIARIRRELPAEFVVQDTRDAEEKIRHACDESRLEGGSLVASAGWCAPSETLYDLCPIRMTQEGIISLPQIQTRRGGIRYPADFDWASVWSSIGFDLTEEEVIAGTEKNCVEVPCPTEWQECRMDVSGLCIRTPILMERGWPERIEQFMQGALLVHAHKINARKLAKMEALSEKIVIPGPRPGTNGGDPVVDPHGPGATESLLSILELQVQYQRYRDRLSQSGGTLEMIAPYWMRGILKSDLRKKLGIDNRWSISDAQVDNYLRAVGVNPQYVYDWQDSFEHPMNPSGFGGPIPLKWPEKLKFLLYPAGTFFQLSDDVINLDGVYDHASLIENVYTGLFSEEGWQVCKRCLDSYVIELDLCPNGLSGTQLLTSCDAMPEAPASNLLPAGSCGPKA